MSVYRFVCYFNQAAVHQLKCLGLKNKYFSSFELRVTVRREGQTSASIKVKTV